MLISHVFLLAISRKNRLQTDFLSELAEAEEISTNELMKIIIQEFRKALTHIA